MTDCGHELYWRGMYRGAFDLITPESIAHPAKAAPRLCFRILEHLEELGLLHQGDTILDPMAGISTTLLCAAHKGYQSIGIELEPKFVLYSLQNFKKITSKYCVCKEDENENGYLRWLRAASDYTEQEMDGPRNKEDQQDILQSGMFNVNTPEGIARISDRDSPSGRDQTENHKSEHWQEEGANDARSTVSNKPGYEGQISEGEESSLEGRKPNRKGLQSNLHGESEISTGASDSYGANSRSPLIEIGEGASYQRQQIRQSARKFNFDDNFKTRTDAQIKRQLAKSSLPEVCETCGKPIIPYPVIIQGDARNLSQMLVERGLVTVSSPPYAISDTTGGLNYKPPRLGTNDTTGRNPNAPNYVGMREGYGHTPGQIGNLKDRPICLTSPPYGDAIDSERHGIDLTKLKDRDSVSSHSQLEEGMLRYGHTEGQIGALKDKPLIGITSPPYSDVMGRQSHEGASAHGEGIKPSTDAHYGNDPSNIGNLPDKPFKVAMSPPYEDSDTRAGISRPDLGKNKYLASDYRLYPNSQGQIGQEKNESYLDAMRLVYAEIARVADVLAIVIKNPTRNGKLRRLDLDTIALLEQTGWRIHCQHRALLFEEQEQGHLLDGSTKQVKGRLSFFKRLSYQKGQPVANFEDVILAVK